MAPTLKGKVSVQLFGGSQIKAAPSSVNSLLLGVIGGVATGLFTTKAQDGVTDIYGLKGDFYAQVLKTAPEDMLVDGETVKAGTKYIELVQSGRCFLHDSIQGPIENLFLGTRKTDDKGNNLSDENGKPIYEDGKHPIKSIEFGFKVFAERATNKAGFTWVFEPVGEAKAADPLAAQKAATASLLGMTPEGKALPAPEGKKK